MTELAQEIADERRADRSSGTPLSQMELSRGVGSSGSVLRFDSSAPSSVMRAENQHRVDARFFHRAAPAVASCVVQNPPVLETVASTCT